MDSDFIIWKINNVPLALSDCFDRKWGALNSYEKYDLSKCEKLLDRCKEESIYIEEEYKKRIYSDFEKNIQNKSS